jgi:hypothetical protein
MSGASAAQLLLFGEQQRGDEAQRLCDRRKKSIGELAPNEGLRLVARTLFERLWEYDQVVFNTSRSVRK